MIILIFEISNNNKICSWVLKAQIQKHRGKPLLFHDNCPGFFYVHYTTHGTKQLWLSVLLKVQAPATGRAGIRTHILATPELESNALDRSATTLHNRQISSVVYTTMGPRCHVM